MLKIYQVPTSAGSFNKGSEKAPKAILDSGLTKILKEVKLDFALAPPVKSVLRAHEKDGKLMRNQMPLVDINRQLYTQILHNSKKRDINLVLGGDHSIAIGSFFATRKLNPDAKIVYIDAHPDCNQPDTSPTANVHGVPVSTILGDGIYGDFNLKPFGYRDITMLGIKDIDDAEWSYIQKHKIRHYTMSSIIEHGIGAAMAEILDWAGESPVHVGLDIDSIDSTEAPGTGIVNRGGLSYREIKYICQKLSLAKICAIDVVEVNPDIDVDNKTVQLAAELILDLLGQNWSPYVRYLSMH